MRATERISEIASLMRWIGSADFHPNAERLKRGAKVHLCAGMRLHHTKNCIERTAMRMTNLDADDEHCKVRCRFAPIDHPPS
jgi:hypothetical protein